MGQQLLLLTVLTATLLSWCAAAYAWSCSRHASASHSLAKRVIKLESAAEEWNCQAEQFDLRLKRITSRAAMAAAREAKGQTATSPDTDEPPNKAATLRKLGIVGANAQRRAFEIHSRGGLTDG